MIFRSLLLIASASVALTASAHAAGAHCVGPANAQFCNDAFGNQTLVNRDGNSTRIQFSAINRPMEDENNTAAMMTDTGWQTDDMPPGTTVDPALSYQLDRVSTPLPQTPTR
jgi:hypothetical protein